MVSEVCESVVPTKSDLVGIDAQFPLDLQAILQGRAGVFALEHLILLELAQVEVALVPKLEAGEFVRLRQERMRLSVALDLRRFIERFPAYARLGVFAGQRLLC